MCTRLQETPPQGQTVFSTNHTPPCGCGYRNKIVAVVAAVAVAIAVAVEPQTAIIEKRE